MHAHGICPGQSGGVCLSAVVKVGALLSWPLIPPGWPGLVVLQSGLSPALDAIRLGCAASG
eukprot:1862656-Karenia_brevis.AAC.1